MEMPFDQMPSGWEIAKYYVRNLANQKQTFEGFDLWKDGEDYCYVWEYSRIDMDYKAAYLLEVRTKTGAAESRDLLLVWSDEEIRYIWRNTPHSEQHGEEAWREYLQSGLAWFAREAGWRII